MVLEKFISKLKNVYHYPASNGLLSITAWVIHLWLLAQVGHAAPLQTVTEVRFRSDPASTRVVIETNGALRYTVERLPDPDRLYIDLFQARLASGWQKKKLSVHDARITDIRVAQHRHDKVRVVLDIQQLHTYQVFVLKKPYRIVIDLQSPTQAHPSLVQTQTPKSTPPPTLAVQPTIIIDPGHGGKDPGALGPKGLLEKDVVLQVAKALRQLIRQHLPRYRVIMTRETDVFVPLTERTKLANDNQAEIFLSIHTNASKRHNVRGIETWYFSFEAKTERAQQIAARENNMSSNQFSELERILRDLHETDRINQSALLAGTTQKALVRTVSQHDPTTPDRGVDGAPFIVLLRTKMPSILVEIGFLTNRSEAARLQRNSYQQALAQGIFQGLDAFLSKSVMRID